MKRYIVIVDDEYRGTMMMHIDMMVVVVVVDK